jgi:hypothetical protein
VRWVRSAWLQRRLWLVAGVVGAVAVAGTWWLLSRGTRGAEIATVLGLVGLLVPAVPRVVTWLVAGESNESKRLLSAARRLAGKVREREENVLARLLADIGEPQPAKLEFSQPKLLYWRTDGGDRRGSLAQIESYYRQLRRGRLVVLGEAGAGKTVLAITLIRDLTAAIVATSPSQEGSEGPIVVPVRLSLPAFDPVPGERNLDEVLTDRVAEQLERWLADHLVTVYGVKLRTAQALVTQGWILPVLDGLDEMDPVDEMDPLRVWPSRAASVLRALNRPTGVGLRRVVLTCRTERYAQLTDYSLDNVGINTGGEAEFSTRVVSARNEPLVVQDATVVMVEPLTAANVLAYLIHRFPDPVNVDRCQPRWHPVTDRLALNEPGDPLVTALQSPLRLFLTVTAYRHEDSRPSELTGLATDAQFDEHLFPQLVPAVLQQNRHQPAAQQYTAQAVTRWLTTLAHHLAWQGEQGGSFSDLRLDLLWPAAGSRAPRYAAAAAIATAAGAVLAFGFNVLARWPPNVLSVFGLAVFVLVAAWIALKPVVDLRRLDLSAFRAFTGRQRIGRLLLGGLVIGLLGGFIVAFVSSVAEPTDQPMVTFKFSVIGFVGGLMVALSRGPATRPTIIDRPARLVQQGVIHTLAAMIAFSFVLVVAGEVGAGVTAGVVGRLVAGLAALLAFGLVIGPVGGFAVGLAVGLNSHNNHPGALPFVVVALVVGLIFMAKSPWPRYLFAVLLLAQRGNLPWRPAAFMDWAYQTGLMRLSGIAVQFRHREFQTWLVTGDQPGDGPQLQLLSTGITRSSTQ